MKRIAPLFLGILGTFAFSWAGLILIPNFQIGHLDPQVDEEGNDPYPAPKSGMANRGRQIYAANGCVYCHSQQMRGDYAASDLERTRDLAPKPKWGERRSAPRDYLFERPVMLGKMRLGPDLANIGKSAPAEKEDSVAGANPAPSGSASPQTAPATNPAPGAAPATAPAKGAGAASPSASVQIPPATTSPAPGASPPMAPAKVPGATPPAPSPAVPLQNATEIAKMVPGKSIPPLYSAAWHHRHLFSPRSLVFESNMPAYHFLYEKRRISGERAADALQVGEGDGVPEGWEVVPTYDARCLVAYLMSLDQSHALQEVKAAAAGPAAASASPAAAPKEAK